MQFVPVILTKPTYLLLVLHERQRLSSIAGTWPYQPVLLRAAFLWSLTPKKGKDFHLPCEVPWWTSSIGTGLPSSPPLLLTL